MVKALWFLVLVFGATHSSALPASAARYALLEADIIFEFWDSMNHRFQLSNNNRCRFENYNLFSPRQADRMTALQKILATYGLRTDPSAPLAIKLYITEIRCNIELEGGRFASPLMLYTSEKITFPAVGRGLLEVYDRDSGRLLKQYSLESRSTGTKSNFGVYVFSSGDTEEIVTADSLLGGLVSQAVGILNGKK